MQKINAPKEKKEIYEIQELSGNIVDVLNNEIYSGKLCIKNGKIEKIIRVDETFVNYVIPGFIDSHIHIESSMVAPSEFARTVVKNGTIAVIADPHEIANVVGIKGVDFMIKNGKKVPFKFYFGAPSCVPATKNETSGAIIDAKEVAELLKREDIKFLGEVMDIGGVISGEKEIIAKINAAKTFNKQIDGHAPGLLDDDLKKYIETGITTDHECCNKDEAVEKIKLGMKILIREGSAAKDFDALSSLIEEYPDFCMLSSDDKHPHDLVDGHIDLLIKKSLKLGYDKMKILKCACVNPVLHYDLDVGLLQEGDNADFVVIDNFIDFNILKTVINGIVVSENGWSLIPEVKTELINNFQAKFKNEEDFLLQYLGEKINVIGAKNKSLITKKLYLEPKISNNEIISDLERDILKIAVVNRYENTSPSVAFINGFGLKNGAIASSVAHDSHNIVVVGVRDKDIKRAVNLVIESNGGLAVVNNDSEMILPLPIAGLMSDKSVFKVAEDYQRLEAEVEKMGSTLSDAFMTMSFMCLLVIPEIKLSDKGLFISE